MIRPGDRVLDIGAHEGAFTVLFSDLVGRAGGVHAFEPVAPTFARLDAAIRRTAWFDNVHLVNAACGNTTGHVAMFVPGTDRGQASAARHRAGSWATDPHVHRTDACMLRIDDYLARWPAGRMTFAKIDVEGAELNVLRGMKATLLRDRPLVCLEIYGRWTCDFGYAPREALDFLSGVGYDRWIVLRDGWPCLSADRVAQQAADESLDVLCAIQSVHGARLSAFGRE